MKNSKKESLVEEKIKENKVKFNLKSKNVFKDKVDIMYEISTKKDKELIEILAKEKDIISLNLIKQD